MIVNPMDNMTYLSLKESGLPKNRIIGMGGALDSARFKTYLSLALEKPSNDIHGMVIGGHGDTTMIPLTRLATYNGMPVANFISNEKLDEVASATMVGGKTLTGMLGTSAWYALVRQFLLVDGILNDQKESFLVLYCLKVNMANPTYVGSVVVGRNGWETIIDVETRCNEQDYF